MHDFVLSFHILVKQNTNIPKWKGKTNQQKAARQLPKKDEQQAILANKTPHRQL